MKKKHFEIYKGSFLFSLPFLVLIFSFSPSLLADEYMEYVKREFASEKDHVLQDAQRHFIVISQDRALAEKILSRELDLYQKFHKTFKTLTFWDDPAIVKIFPERVSFIQQFHTPTAQAFMCKFKKDSRTHRLIASWVQPGLIENLIPHETAHIFIADLARIEEINSAHGNKRVLPRWIDEGIAQYFETHDSLLDYKIYMMHIALNENGHIPFEQFFSITQYPEDHTYYFYIQSEIVTRFLLSQPNGYQKLRNTITIFRSKVKDGSKAFTLSFPEYARFSKLREDLKAWCGQHTARYHPDIDKLNRRISDIFKIGRFNKNLYKEIAMGMVAYQLHINQDYQGSIRLASAALEQKNGFALAYDAQIKSLIKTDNLKVAQGLIDLYKTTDPKNAYRLIADIKHESKHYQEEIEWLKKLLEANPENGYFICMRIAFVYYEFLKDTAMSNFYVSQAEKYQILPDEFY
ncbi:MAG: hypothetical protein JW928_01545 [Candidatus Aureabacteria bacterium]|nr:hypothetical protein [Candidatus Auribacterota bacterium]